MDIDINIRKRFIEDFPIPKGNKKKPYIIVFDANIGMGKSTISKLIAKYDHSVILNNDEVRRWLNDFHDRTNLRKELQDFRLKELLKNNNSCICDSNFNFHWKELKDYYDELGYKYYVVKLQCRDEIIKERLSKRIVDVNGENYSIASFDDYLEIKNKFLPVDSSLIDYVINTEGSHEEAEKQVIEFLKKYSLI